MKLFLTITQQIEGIFKAEINELPCKDFILNRDFMIDTILLDGKSASYQIQKEKYQKVTIPEIERHQALEIHYHGVLDGTSGIWPYVKETTLDDFVILRFESLYYPMFHGAPSEESFYDSLESSLMEVEVQTDGRDCYSNLTWHQKIGNQFIFSGINPVLIIARCHTLETKEMRLIAYEKLAVDLQEVTDFSTQVFNIMNERCCQRELRNIQLIFIPSGFGSFVLGKNLFLAEDSWHDRRSFIHELIHLGWNPNYMLLDYKTARARFFDEALTQYLMAEAYECLYPGSIQETYAGFKKEYQKIMIDNHLPITALSDYYKEDLGDLSYYYGPIVLKEIEKTTTPTAMREAINHLILDYQDRPVTFEAFINLFEDEKTRQRARELIFETTEPIKLLKEVTDNVKI